MSSPKLLEQYRERLRVKHYSLRTEDAYLHWVRRFIYFHAKRPARVPVVLTEGEVRALLGQLDGTRWLATSLLYATGMRLRVKDVDFERREITVRDGKGGRDRRTTAFGHQSRG